MGAAYVAFTTAKRELMPCWEAQNYGIQGWLKDVAIM